MGQRLVITPYAEEDFATPICKMYFHWSAYTTSAIYTAAEVLSYFYGDTKGNLETFAKRHTAVDNRDYNPDNGAWVPQYIDKTLKPLFDKNGNIDFSQIPDYTLRLIRICEYLGGGIRGGKPLEESGDPEICEWDFINKKYPNEFFKPYMMDRNDGLIAVSEEGMDSFDQWSEGDMDIRLTEDPSECLVYNSVFFNEGTEEEQVREFNELEDDEKIEEFDLDLNEPIPYKDLAKVAEKLDEAPGLFKCNGSYYSLIA